MKKIAKYMLMAFALAGLSGLLGSCNDDKDYPPVIVPENYGSGTWDSPMSVDQVIAGASGSGAWITGYIVGWVDTGISNAYSEETVKFEVPCTVASNMVMAASPDERDIEKCIPIQLVSGTDARTALNLVNNPANLGKLVSIKGNCERYFGRNAVKAVSNFNWDAVGVYEEPPVPTLYEATITNGGLNDFTFDNISVPDGVQIWKVDTKYGLVGNAYVSGTRYAVDTWAISPEIDLSGYSEGYFTVHNACNYLNDSATFSQYCNVAVREIGGSWTEVTMPTLPAGNSWTFIDSGNIDLTQFMGKKIQIGFHYTSTASLAGTWEIDEVKVYADK